MRHEVKVGSGFAASSEACILACLLWLQELVSLHEAVRGRVTSDTLLTSEVAAERN